MSEEDHFYCGHLEPMDGDEDDLYFQTRDEAEEAAIDGSNDDSIWFVSNYDDEQIVSLVWAGRIFRA